MSVCVKPFRKAVMEAVAIAALSIVLGSSVASADCFGRNDRLVQAEIDDFNRDPKAFLTRFPSGGATGDKKMAELTKSVRDLVASSPQTLENVLSLAHYADVPQKRAIGSGLGQATLVCLPVDHTFAEQIQTSVVGLQRKPVVHRSAARDDQPIMMAEADPDDNTPLVDAFFAVTGTGGNIGAAGGGGGGGTGGGGGGIGQIVFGGTGGSGGSAPPPATSIVNNPSSNPNTSSVGGVSFPGTSSGSGTTQNSVTLSISRAGSP